jgi:hypothetical protein
MSGTNPWIAAPLVDPGAVAITGGTGVPIVLATGGIPMIGLSSGSVAAGGAITGITALPLLYPAAYCYFPANILAASIAAGFYYCTFSSTTTGTAFLNTYTSGVPTIPTSPTPVVAGQGAFTGDTGEEFAHMITVPANALGANGLLRVRMSTAHANNANVKTVRCRLSGTGGTVFFTSQTTSSAAAWIDLEIANTGVASAQISRSFIFAGAGVPTSGTLGTIDTTAATTLVTSHQRATATDNFVILPPTVEYLRSP